MKKPDPLNMPDYDANKTWKEENPDTILDHLHGVMWRIDKIMTPFYEYLGWGLTFASFLIWIAIIFFLVMLFIALVIGIGSGILGIDLVPPADVAKAMALK